MTTFALEDGKGSGYRARISKKCAVNSAIAVGLDGYLAPGGEAQGVLVGVVGHGQGIVHSRNREQAPGAALQALCISRKRWCCAQHQRQHPC